jgi:hypothetical protein
MIVVKLMGGLGNQMFQYAFAKNLSIKNNTSLKIDLSFLLNRSPRENFIFRDFDLDIFESNYDFVTEEEVDKAAIFNSSKGIVSKLFSKKQTKLDVQLIEQHFYFEASNIKKDQDIYLDGYWQSEKYFLENEVSIRADFKFKHPLSEIEKKMNEIIVHTNSVCVNFRRTDFLDLKNSADTHGVIDYGYYEQAIQRIVENVKSPHFFIFSDDIEWCKENVKITHPITFVEHSFKGEKFSSYLQLMKNCKHFIIPNSTFAWWAAWLSESKDKMVIAPNNWFKDPTLQSQTSDIIPSSWIKL